jgi:hypothetical protein
MASEDLQQGSNQSRKSEAVRIINNDEKIEVEIRDIIRIKPSDFSALKNSFEEWASQWD